MNTLIYEAPIAARPGRDLIRQNSVPAQIWRRMVADAAPRASGAIFGWCPTSANMTVEPRVIVVQFFDGYAQRRPAGLNTREQEWSLEFTDIRIPVAKAILAFLEARNGVDVFNWTPPRLDRTLDVICPTWGSSYGQRLVDFSLTMNVSATFHQVYS
ncbi:phage tail protein [Paraburkholderia adhaesiva]|uniref:phage tail protein n=1 Tax=Paraburkholderia adhaesiva TaxID=2883244 RepID=UPI001F295115|nr:phage tail protein [Paraburkholderia adhaesiva]